MRTQTWAALLILKFNSPNDDFMDFCILYINGLAQECSYSIAKALQLLQSWTEPSILCDSTGGWNPSSWKTAILLF